MSAPSAHTTPSANTTRGTNGRPYLRLRHRVYREESVCWLCGEPVDRDRPRLLPTGKEDPKSKSMDHVAPIVLGGDPMDRANCRLAHLGCNKNRGHALERSLQTTEQW